jgi:hypothetical protein
VHLDVDYIGRRVYGIIYEWENDNGPNIWANFVLLLPFKCFQVETSTQSEHNFVKIKRHRRKEIAKYIIKPVMVITTSHVIARCGQLLVIRHRVTKFLKRVEETRDKKMVAKKMMLELM